MRLSLINLRLRISTYCIVKVWVAVMFNSNIYMCQWKDAPGVLKNLRLHAFEHVVIKVICSS